MFSLNKKCIRSATGRNIENIGHLEGCKVETDGVASQGESMLRMEDKSVEQSS